MTEYAKILGARLRTVRQRSGMSLERVQQMSGYRWKAVVVGSYERGDRAVSVQKLAELARFYGVPMSELLPPDDLDLGADVSTSLVLNLERLREVPVQDTEPVARWCADIAHHRKTHETLLQIRSGDIDSLAELCNMPTTELTTRLVSWGVLAPSAGIRISGN